MPKPSKRKKAAPQTTYFRVLVTYSDGETSGHRVFKLREKAQRWAEQQQQSRVVKKVAVEPITLKRAEGRLRQASKPAVDK